MIGNDCIWGLFVLKEVGGGFLLEERVLDNL